MKPNSIQGLAQLTKVQLLNVSGCSELEELPNMETLASLEELTADGWVKLKSIGELLQLTKLQKPSFGSFSESEEERAEHCLSLDMLHVCRCPKLHSKLAVLEEGMLHQQNRRSSFNYSIISECCKCRNIHGSFMGASSFALINGYLVYVVDSSTINAF